MITKISVTSKERSAVKWWDSALGLADVKELAFEPGLNILWARNGLGKSTVLTLIENLFCCHQVGRPFVSHSSVDELYFQSMCRLGEEKGGPNGILPIHDGQAILSFNPDRRPGLAHGGIEFDYDFMDMMKDSITSMSAGQGTQRAIVQTLEPFMTGEQSWPEIEWKLAKTTSNYIWQERANFLDKFLAGTLEEKGPKTIIMDEPTKSLDLDNAAFLWSRILEWRHEYQIIVATHSPFALGIEGANYIELVAPEDRGAEKTYLQMCVESVKKMTLAA